MINNRGHGNMSIDVQSKEIKTPAPVKIELKEKHISFRSLMASVKKPVMEFEGKENKYIVDDLYIKSPLPYTAIDKLEKLTVTRTELMNTYNAIHKLMDSETENDTEEQIEVRSNKIMELQFKITKIIPEIVSIIKWVVVDADGKDVYSLEELNTLPMEVVMRILNMIHPPESVDQSFLQK